MRKKIFLLFLVCLFTVFTASQAFSEVDYKLTAKNGGNVEEDTSDEDDNGSKTFYRGGNYYRRYYLPELELVSFDNSLGDAADEFTVLTSKDFKVNWTIDQGNDNAGTALVLQCLSEDAKGEFIILSGILPASEEDYAEDDDGNKTIYKLSFTATISEIENTEYQSYVGKLVTFDNGTEITDIEKYGVPDPEDEENIVDYTPASDAIVAKINDQEITTLAELKEKFKAVSSTYSVNINAPKDDMDAYSYYIGAGTDDPAIDVPEWIELTVNSRDENFGDEDDDETPKPITSITLKFNEKYKEIFKNGTKGVIRIPFMDTESEPSFLLEWDVELFEPFTISTSPKTLAFDLTAGGDPVVKEIEYTGADPVKFTQGTTITGVNFKVISADSKITVTAEATSAATAGEKTTTFTFNDANNNSDELSVTVKVTVPTTPKITISGTKTLTVTAGGESVSTTLTAGGSISGALSWEIVSVPDGLNVELTKSSDKTADFSISAESSATAGQKNVSIKVTDSVSALNETANLVITVEEAPKEEKQDITSSITLKDSSGKSVSKPFSGLKPGEKGSFTITLPSEIVAKIWTLLINNVAVKTVTVSGTATMAADNDWLTISNYSSTGATIDADVPSNLSGNAAISFSVTDTNDKEYTADLGTISKTSTSTGSSGSGCNVSFGALSLAVAALLFVRKNAKN